MRPRMLAPAIVILQSAKSSQCNWVYQTALSTLFLAGWFANGCFAAKSEELAWRTGADFHRQLQAEVSLTWVDQPLREGLMNLARSQQVAIFLDRRVDPGQELTCSIESQPLLDTLREVAGTVNLGIGFVGPVIYVGPPLTCWRLATLSQIRNEQVRKLPAGSHLRLLQPKVVEWPALTEPRLLIARVGATAGITIPNVRAIPHDLWAAAKLPPLTLSEQLTLLLAGFDMSFRFHGNATQVSLSPFPRAVYLERKYRVADPPTVARQYAEEFPQAFVSVDEDQTQHIVVKSVLEDHWKIEGRHDRGPASRQPPAKSAGTGADKRYTLTVQNKAVGPLLELLTKKLNLEIQFDDEIEAAQQEQLVSAAVQDATQDELLDAIATPAGLAVTVVDGVVHISRKSATPR